MFQRLLFVASLFVATHLFAQAATTTATVTSTFDINGNPSGTEYFIELKGGTVATPTWTEVAKGNASPLVFTVSSAVLPSAGASATFHVRARTPSVPNTTSGPSNDVVVTIPNAVPKNLTIVFVFAPSS